MKTKIIAAAALAAASLTAAPAGADDLSDIEATINAVYAVISGPVGEARDFDAMRGLYMEGAAMGAVGPGDDGQGRGRIITLDDYIATSGPRLAELGFIERPTRTEITRYGEIAYARSAYEGVRSDTGEVFVTGVNFITLFKVGGEWKVASILWRSADEAWPVDRAFD